jgi:hypothetical protein
MMSSNVRAQATESSHSFQASHYREGDRDLIDTKSGLKPLSVDVVGAMGTLNLANRWQFGYTLSQDVWSGATPVATAPLAFNGNRTILRDSGNGVIESGASPFVNGTMTLDSQLQPTGSQDAERSADSVLIMSSASPETRRQADFNLNYEWDDAMMSWTMGTSSEDDYRSYFAGLNGRLDFNQKTTSLSGGISYSSNGISAVLDPDLRPYLTTLAYDNRIRREKAADVLRDDSHEWSGSIGWTQILNRSALMELNAGFIHSRGFLENPYKATITAFYDPAQWQPLAGGSVVADVRALMEQRPDQRLQLGIGGKFIQHIAGLDAALHSSYEFSSDSWGVSSHTVELNWVQPLPAGWTVTPTLRYYSQQQADFYVDYLVSGQRYRNVDRDISGRQIWESVNSPDLAFVRNSDGNFLDSSGNVVDPSKVSLRPRYRYFDFAQLPASFSSDYRLASFGSLSAGVNVSKNLGRYTTLEFGIEYYQRASSFRIGGGAGSAFADYDALMTTATLIFNPQLQAGQRRLDRLGSAANADDQHHGHMPDSTVKHEHPLPAGIMFAHAMRNAGDMMLGYVYDRVASASYLQRGSKRAADSDVVGGGCSAVNSCRLAPDGMVMSMSMLDVGYAVSADLSLMLMAQFMDMNMTLRDLEGRPPSVPGAHEHKNLRGHTTGGFGDTIAGGVYRLSSGAHGEWLLGLGVSIPTGSVTETMRRMFREDGGLMHFDMQTGSGTWDLLPSLTYLGGNHRALSWGAQVSGSYPLGNRNESGYRLGDVIWVNTWGAYALNSWISATGRLSYTDQKAIEGDFDSYNARLGPMDYPENSGGRFLDAGLGLRLSVPAGEYAGHSFALEWLEPVSQDVNGFQLPRSGTLIAAWRYMF